jgi:GTPase Era involved in 16S rRNA processing
MCIRVFGPPSRPPPHSPPPPSSRAQKGILIGKGGVALKQLGQQSRAEIEQFLEREVYLELSVEVSEAWRENKKSLESFGYFDSQYT